MCTIGHPAASPRRPVPTPDAFPMLVPIGLILAGGALLAIGAEGLVRGSASIARSFGMAPLLIGLTVVGFGTSAPELVASLQAARVGSGGLAVGNVIGSNIANIALVLGLAATIRPLPVARRIVRIDAPLALAVSLIVAAMMWDRQLGSLEGLLLTGGILFYVYWSFRQAKRILPPHEHAEEMEEKAHLIPLRLSIPLALAGLAGLVFGANLFVDGARRLATSFGVSEAVIGLTIMAVGTSLPEIATTLAASMKGLSDLITGNAIGSNIFNTLCVLGFTALFIPFSTGEITPVDMTVFLGSAALIWVAMATRRRLSRWEGATLLAGYLLYVIWLY